MKRLQITTIIAIFCSVIAWGAVGGDSYPIPPDQDAIEKAVFSDESPYFYPKLFDRYLVGDTTLNIQDYRHLYYGYIYQDNYRPLETLNYADSITVLLAKNSSDSTLGIHLFDNLERYAIKALSIEPFNLNYLNILVYISQKRGDLDLAELFAYKMYMIKQTIFSSGTGLAKDSPWHILYRNDEQDILGSLGITYSRSIVVSASIEYFHLPEKDGDNRGYYFEISRLYLKKPEGYAPRPSKRFEINSKTNPRSKLFESYKEY